MWLIKINDVGVIQWDQVYGGIENDEVSDIIQTDEGDFILAGYTASDGAGGRDMCLVKISPSIKDLNDLPINVLGIFILIVLIILFSMSIRKKMASEMK